MKKPYTGAVQRRPDAKDAEVGQRVRTRRLEQRLSQTELADRIGVTFQQVQKYEKGVNRIGASRLQQIASALNVPITFFFDAKAGVAEGTTQSVFSLVQSSSTVRIVKAMGKIKNRKTRQMAVELVEELAEAATRRAAA